MPISSLLNREIPRLPRKPIAVRGEPVAADEALDKSTISQLSAILITRMTEEELIRVISIGGRPLLDRGTWPRLEYLDRPTLERLAYLARYCCQNGGY